MVSKVVKRTPTKPPTAAQSRRHRRRSSSPLKEAIAAAPSLVASSINRSLRTCRRRLLKLFTRLAILSTPKNSHKKKKKKKKHGFRRLKPLPFDLDAVSAASGHLPPPISPKKATIFLDLDETLVHSQTEPPNVDHDFIVRPTIDGQVMTFYVVKRPGVDEMLREASRLYEVVVFTAGLREYASLVLDRLDPEGELISHRLYRDSCREMEGGRLVKDLAATGRDLDKVVILDDNPNAYALQPENAIPMAPFVDDLGDQELRKVMRFFEDAVRFEDMRDAVAFYLSENGVRMSQA